MAQQAQGHVGQRPRTGVPADTAPVIFQHDRQDPNTRGTQFENNDFKGAIQNALVEVIDQVKIKAGHPKNKNGRDLDGDDLMNHVFGCDNQEPKIKFNALRNSLDKAEQRGLMNLFKGIVGVRDKKAHLNFIQQDPLKTIEYLSLASLLMRLLDEFVPARKRKRL
jgi:uncharacterized protein (TIGR02391 family)